MILAQKDWRERAALHAEAAEGRTRDHLARRRRHQKHPVYDFLFEYYPVRPAHLKRWHPGAGVRLHDPEGAAEHNQWRDYVREGECVRVDVDSFWERRGGSMDYIADLLRSTESRPAHFDCFGLHEWAMVYHGQTRHDLPLRLPPEATNEVVASHQLKCTHYDAYRHFTPPAKTLNLTVLTRETQPDYDQGGCVHANMDLYKWASKMGPLVPGELFLETFDLARDARVLDMEASPYDCRGLGFGAVAIETPQGKAEYVVRQRELAERGNLLRMRLVSLIDQARPLN